MSDGTVTLPIKDYLELLELKEQFFKGKEVVYVSELGSHCFLLKSELITNLSNRLEKAKGSTSGLYHDLEELDCELKSLRKESIEFKSKINSMSIFGFIKYKYDLWKMLR